METIGSLEPINGTYFESQGLIDDERESKHWADEDEELADKEEAFILNYHEKHGRYPSDEVERDY